MVKILFLYLSVISSAFGINATIIVLEAPIFGEPDESSPVIQYYRKGDDIYIHPHETHQDPYKNQKFKFSEKVKPTLYEDPFLEKPYIPEKQGRFFKTLSNSGREAYVLKEHVLIEYKDAREFDQEVIAFDHTDYRIEEPLPENYPFTVDRIYKGALSMALGRANFDAYPYRQKILDQSFNLSTEFSFAWSKEQPEADPSKRFFFGAIGGFHYSTQDYVMSTQNASQTNFRLFIGPYASYDIYRSPKNILQLSISTQVFLLDNMDVAISSDIDSSSERRTYSSTLAISPQAGAAYKWRDYFEGVDLSLGFNMRVNLPRDYKTNDAGENDLLWRRLGAGDSYYQGLTSEITYFLSFDNTY